MAKAGEVRIRLSRSEARILSDWLLRSYAPSSHGDSALARSIGLQLRKAALRKRSTSIFIFLMQREHALWFAKLRHLWAFTDGGGKISVVVPQDVRAIGQRFRDAMLGRGRPTLSEEGLETRVHGRMAVDDRHRRRLARRLRYEQKVAAWHAAGNTLLGGGDPYPEI